MFQAVLIVACTLAALAVLQVICARIDERKFPPPGRLVRLDGRDLHVQEQGTGKPTVLLEAGIAASSLSWSLTQPCVAALTSTCSYDRAGFGWSSSTGHGCSLKRIAAELHQLVAALEIPKPYIIVAHSFGNYIATAYAQRFGQELGGVVLVDPLTPEEWIEPTRTQRWMLRRGVWFSRAGGVLAAFGVIRACLWLLERGRLETPRGVLRLFGGKATETVERILGELVKLPAETVRLIRARWSTAKFFWTMAGYIRAVPQCARELQGANIPAHIPVTVLSGRHQPEIRLREHAGIAAHSQRGKHLIAAKSAHWIHLDEPELVARAVREMIESVEDASGAKAQDVSKSLSRP